MKSTTVQFISDQYIPLPKCTTNIKRYCTIQAYKGYRGGGQTSIITGSGDLYVFKSKHSTAKTIAFLTSAEKN